MMTLWQKDFSLNNHWIELLLCGKSPPGENLGTIGVASYRLATGTPPGPGQPVADPPPSPLAVGSDKHWIEWPSAAKRPFRGKAAKIFEFLNFAGRNP